MLPVILAIAVASSDSVCYTDADPENIQSVCESIVSGESKALTDYATPNDPINHVWVVITKSETEISFDQMVLDAAPKYLKVHFQTIGSNTVTLQTSAKAVPIKWNNCQYPDVEFIDITTVNVKNTADGMTNNMLYFDHLELSNDITFISSDSRRVGFGGRLLTLADLGSFGTAHLEIEKLVLTPSFSSDETVKYGVFDDVCVKELDVTLLESAHDVIHAGKSISIRKGEKTTTLECGTGGKLTVRLGNDNENAVATAQIFHENGHQTEDMADVVYLNGLRISTPNTVTFKGDNWPVREKSTITVYVDIVTLDGAYFPVHIRRRTGQFLRIAVSEAAITGLRLDGEGISMSATDTNIETRLKVDELDCERWTSITVTTGSIALFTKIDEENDEAVIPETTGIRIVYEKVQYPYVSQSLNGPLYLASGCDVTLEYQFDWESDSVWSVFEQYHENNPRDLFNEITTASLKSDWEYMIGFAKAKSRELSEGLTCLMKISELNVSMEPYDGTKNTLRIARVDFPIAFMYGKGEPTLPMLSSSEPFNLTHWDVDFVSTAIDMFDEFFPEHTGLGIGGNTCVQEIDGRHYLSYKIKSRPESAVDVIIYVANETYREILSEFLDYATILTPDSLDGMANRLSPTSKNIALVIMDSVEEGRSINLRGLREDANVFVFGVPFAGVDAIIECFAEIVPLDDMDNPDYFALMNASISKVLDRYQDFLPRVSISVGAIQTMFLCAVTYSGSLIESKNLFALVSKFENAGGLTIASDFTYADMVTYEDLSSRTLKNLILIMLSMKPVDILSVKVVDFTNDGWTIHTQGAFEIFGEQTASFRIPKSHVTGELTIFTYTPDVSLNIPTDLSASSTIKAISLVAAYDMASISGSTLPSFPVLSDRGTGPQRLQALMDRLLMGKTQSTADVSSKSSVQLNDLISEGLAQGAKLLTSSVCETHPSSGSDASSGKSKSYLDLEVNVSFTGDWSRVSTVDGLMVVKAAKSNVTVSDVPDVVKKVLSVDSNGNISIGLANGGSGTSLTFEKPHHLFENRTYFFDAGLSVDFSDLIFTGGRRFRVRKSFTHLVIGDDESQITTRRIECGKFVHSVLSDARVTESITIGYGSTLEITSGMATRDTPSLTLKYQLSASAPRLISPLFTPSAIHIDYVPDDRHTKISRYIDDVKQLRQFSSNADCEMWKSKVQMEHDTLTYPSGSFTSSIMCEESDSQWFLTLRHLLVEDGPQDTGYVSVKPPPPGQQTQKPDPVSVVAPPPGEQTQNPDPVQPLTVLPTEGHETVTFDPDEVTDSKEFGEGSYVLKVNGDTATLPIEIKKTTVGTGSTVVSAARLILDESLSMNGASRLSSFVGIELKEDNKCEIRMNSLGSELPHLDLGSPTNTNVPKSIGVALNLSSMTPEEVRLFAESKSVIASGAGFKCDVWKSRVSIEVAGIDDSDFDWTAECQTASSSRLQSSGSAVQELYISGHDDKGLSAGAIAGIVVACVVVVVVVIVVSVVCAKKRNSRDGSSSSSSVSGADNESL